MTPTATPRNWDSLGAEQKGWAGREAVGMGGVSGSEMCHFWAESLRVLDAFLHSPMPCLQQDGRILQDERSPQTVSPGARLFSV